jgi:hypothetical protein
MQVPERLMPAQDGGLALRTASKSAALRSFHRNHKTSDCGASLDGIGLRSNAWRASFLQTSCNRPSD